MDPRAAPTYETYVICQTQTTDSFRPSYCIHIYCSICALVEMKVGKQWCNYLKGYTTLLDQHYKLVQVTVMLSWYLAVASWWWVFVDIAYMGTSGFTIGLIWSLPLVYYQSTYWFYLFIHAIVWLVLLAFNVIMWKQSRYKTDSTHFGVATS